jgi:sugar O-acyltransferase (sialic acid O-acetyltransferase NeuD family)
MFVAIGFTRRNRARSEIYYECKNKGYELISYVNSKAVLWDEVPMGDNCFIFENNVIQPFVRIGSNVIIWSGNHIGHHSVIGNHCFIASHAVISGNCTIEDGCFIGVNATLMDGIRVARNSLIGAGALILHDTVEGAVYKGSETLPCKLEGQ